MFYHSTENQTITEVVKPPSAINTAEGGWQVSSHYFVYSYGKGGDGKFFCKRDGVYPIEKYMSSDTKEQALKFYRKNYSPKGNEISYDKFKSLMSKLPKPT